MGKEADKKLLSQWTPPYLIKMFADQGALVVGSTPSGAGTGPCESIELTANGALVTFGGKVKRQMIISAHGWGWLT